jgi:hypothetical protein
MVAASQRVRRLTMNPLTWLAIAGILLLIIVAVTLGKIRRRGALPEARKEEVPPKKARVSGEDD